MTRRRTLVVCPGRGSYTRASLGSLKGRSAAATEAIAVCDAARAARGLPTVTALDADEKFRTTRHVAGEHASLLTFAAGYADWLELDRDGYQVVGVAGNSMGWYTALAVAGALPLADAVRLIDTMGAYQQSNVVGGQLLVPLLDGDWRPDPVALAAVESALQSVRLQGHDAAWSIHLGSFAVLGASTEGIKALQAALPEHRRGDRTFPLQLPLHSAFHTSLMQPTADRAAIDLAQLAFTAPDVSLVDGEGRIARPVWADPEQLRAYTLGTQVVAPYDFATSIRTALRHTGAEVIVALGPGNALGGPLASLLVSENWRGARDRASFDAIQRSDAPALLSFGVALQRTALV